jgi:hypothetical protein
VFYLVYFVSFCFSFAFSSCSPKITLLTYYTSLYLVDYACHYTRVSIDEM